MVLTPINAGPATTTRQSGYQYGGHPQDDVHGRGRQLIRRHQHRRYNLFIVQASLLKKVQQ